MAILSPIPFSYENIRRNYDKCVTLDEVYSSQDSFADALLTRRIGSLSGGIVEIFTALFSTTRDRSDYPNNLEQHYQNDSVLNAAEYLLST